MNKYYATVIKTGNSYALRVPKGYVEDAQLKLGEKAALALPIAEPVQSNEHVMKLVHELQQLHSFSELDNPSEWQRTLRQDRELPGRG